MLRHKSSNAQATAQRLAPVRDSIQHVDPDGMSRLLWGQLWLMRQFEGENQVDQEEWAAMDCEKCPVCP